MQGKEVNSSVEMFTLSTVIRKWSDSHPIQPPNKLKYVPCVGLLARMSAGMFQKGFLA